MLDLTYETPKPKVIAGAKHDWELVIGLEVHAQVSSKAKLFSGASTQFGAEPNSNVAFVDAGMPGMLPVINEECVALAVKTGLGLNAEINLKSAFDRKNYFYPDLPQGYQISQLYDPIVGPGEILVDMGPGDCTQSARRAYSPRTRRRQIDPRHGSEHVVCRFEPDWRCPDGNRVVPGHSRPRRSRSLCREVAPNSALSRAPVMATCRMATCAPM